MKLSKQIVGTSQHFKLARTMPCRVVELNKQSSNKKPNFEKLVVSDAKSTYLIDVEEILYCQAFGNYSTIYTSNRSPITTCSALKDIISRLSSDKFIRVHQSYIVRINAIEEITSQRLKLRGQIEIPVSRRCKKVLLKLVSSMK